MPFLRTRKSHFDLSLFENWQKIDHVGRFYASLITKTENRWSIWSESSNARWHANCCTAVLQKSGTIQMWINRSYETRLKGSSMVFETKTNLTENTIATLNDLIQVNIDAQKGFDEAANEIQDLNISNMFRELSTQRSQQAMELQSLIIQNREAPDESGSIAGAIHRGWMNLRTALGSGNQVVLNEAERGEDHIKAKYEEALKCCTGSPVTDVLNRQYAVVKKAHDRVRDIRDAYQE